MLLNELGRNVCIYTDPRHKDFVMLTTFIAYIYIYICILEKYLYVIFFAIHEKFVLIIIIV